MNQNCMIGFPNRIDESSIDGGSWLAALPLANLKNRTLGRVARSADLAPASTFFEIDLATPKKIRAVDLRNHNFSSSGRVRLRATTEPAAINLAPYSEAPENAAWTKGRSAIVSADTKIYTDENGNSVTLKKWREDATANATHTLHLVRNATNETITVSAIVFAAERTRLFIETSNFLNASMNVGFDLAAGTTYGMTADNADYSNGAASIDNLGGGFYRVRLTSTKAAANGLNNALFGLVDAAGNAAYTGNNSSGLYIGGIQIQTGSRLTAYVKNATVAGGARAEGLFNGIGQSYAYDSGWLDAWPVVYPFGTLEWEDDNFWSRQYADEERAGYTAGLTHILPTDTLARFWRVDIADPLNPAGFVQLGRVFIGPAWQPENNMTRGAAIAWETGTEVQEAYSGAEFFDEKTPYRVARFSLDWMGEGEGLSQAFDLMRRAGVSKEVLFVYDPTDTVHALRRQFLGRLRTLSPIEFPYASVTRNAFEIKELL